MQSTDLEMLLTSCVHDMKNSISMIIDSVDNLSEEPKNTKEYLANLRYEASRLNNDLMHLLGVYRMKEQELPVVVDEHEVWEVLQQQFLKNEALLRKYNIAFELECDEDEIWYFDSVLIGGVINNVIVNTVRYTKTKIRLRVYRDQSKLCLEVSDDGNGYPKFMLQEKDVPLQSMNFQSGSTSLGLYFAAKVAKLHKKGEVLGHITLQNGGDLGGGIFTIYIP